MMNWQYLAATTVQLLIEADTVIFYISFIN